MRCDSCGHEAWDWQTECPRCGHSLPVADRPPRPARQETTAHPPEESPPSPGSRGWPKSGRRSASLRGVATPNLYRANAFRVTGLPTDATSRDLRRTADRLRVSGQVAAGAGSESETAPLPLDPPPEASVVTDALEWLRDPEHRFLDEFFWLWPPEAPGSEAHNDAVRHHAEALDGERLAVMDERDASYTTQRHWSAALAGWAEVVDQPEVWERVRARIAELDDPRLTASTAEDLRAGLPAAIVSINASLAVDAAAQGDHDRARRHLRHLRDSPFPTEMIDSVVSEAARPFTERVRSLGEAAEAEADADPAHADGPAERLADEARNHLGVLDAVLPEDHPARVGMHDEIALRLLGCIIPYGNATEDWGRTQTLLDLAEPFAVSPSARQRLEEQIERVRENVVVHAEQGTCWFCREDPPGEDSGYEVELHGEVSETPTAAGTKVNWRTLTVTVPCCPGCRRRARQNQRTLFGPLFVVGAIAIGLGLLSLAGLVGLIDESQESVDRSSDADVVTFLVAALAVGAASVGLGVASLRRYDRRAKLGTTSESKAHDHPAVQRRVDEGWRYGAKPPGVS